MTEKVYDYIEKIKKLYLYKGIYTPLSVSYEITNLCNLKCEHCYNKMKPQVGIALETAEKLNIVRKLKEIGTLEVVICGGEPTLDKDFIEVLNEIKKQRMYITVLTNGLFDKDVRKQVISILDRNDTIQVSVDESFIKDSGKQRKYDLYQKGIVKKQIKELLLTNINIEINITPTRLNQYEIIDIVKELIELGVKTITCTPYVPIGGTDADRIKPNYRYLRDVNKEVINICKKAGVKYDGGIEGHVCQQNKAVEFNKEIQMEYRLPLCEALYFRAHINNIGNVYPCVFLEKEEFKVGNILDSSFDIHKQNISSLLNRTEYTKCDACNLFDECGGGCIGLIYDRYKSFNYADPRCEHVKER